MKEIRIIPCLDIKEGRVVKGINFVNLRDARDPVEAAEVSGIPYLMEVDTEKVDKILSG